MKYFANLVNNVTCFFLVISGGVKFCTFPPPKTSTKMTLTCICFQIKFQFTIIKSILVHIKPFIFITFCSKDQVLSYIRSASDGMHLKKSLSFHLIFDPFIQVRATSGLQAVVLNVSCFIIKL